MRHGSSIGYAVVAVFVENKSFIMSVKAFEFVSVIETVQQLGEKEQSKVIMALNMFVNCRRWG
jgi:hypothetical protein